MPTRSILVADDNRDLADSLVELLRAAGYEAAAAYDGRQAVEAERKMHPGIALLDVQMPELDGCEVARRMRQEPDAPVCIASISGLAPEDEPMRSMGDVFDAHFRKPPDTRALLDFVREKLGDSSLSSTSLN